MHALGSCNQCMVEVPGVQTSKAIPGDPHHCEVVTHSGNPRRALDPLSPARIVRCARTKLPGRTHPTRRRLPCPALTSVPRQLTTSQSMTAKRSTVRRVAIPGSWTGVTRAAQVSALPRTLLSSNSGRMAHKPTGARGQPAQSQGKRETQLDAQRARHERCANMAHLSQRLGGQGGLECRLRTVPTGEITGRDWCPEGRSGIGSGGGIAPLEGAS